MRHYHILDYQTRSDTLDPHGQGTTTLSVLELVFLSNKKQYNLTKRSMIPLCNLVHTGDGSSFASQSI